MGLIVLNGNNLTLNGSTISLGGPDVTGVTVVIGGRWRAFVALADFAPSDAIGLWRGDRQVIGRFRGNTRTGTWRGNNLSATWGQA